MASDWTVGAAKWSAVFSLGALSALGVGWSLWGRGGAEVEIRPVAVREVAPRVEAARVHGMGEREEPAPVEAPTAAVSAPVDAGLEEERAPVEAAPVVQREPERPLSLTRTVNINTATAAELEMLPGIGPAMAARILEHRRLIGRFQRVEQLDDVKGIGPKTLEKLRPLVRVE